jgi:hypothetical protein
MQKYHLYFSATPEALVASMLTAEEFGRYLAVGSHKRSSGVAIFFEVDPARVSDFPNMDIVEKRCVAKADGSPKRSVYLGIYRVLERLPLAALGKLYLTTRDGQVLALDQSELPAEFPSHHYLYDELCPVHPLIASKLNPLDFTRFATNPESPLFVPKVFFAQLDPAAIIGSGKTAEGSLAIHNLPERIKECFEELDEAGKPTKTVDRVRQLSFRWDHIKSGYFIGDQNHLLYYPFPSLDELEHKHHKWVRAAML